MRLSTLVPESQSCVNDTVHYCPSASPFGTSQSTVATVAVQLIPYSPLLPQYQFYWYDTVYYCPSTTSTYILTVHSSPSIIPIDRTKYITATIPILHIRYSTLLTQYQSYWHETVHYYPIISLTDTTQTTPVPVAVLLIWYSPPQPSTVLLIDTVHYCPSTSPSDMRHTTTALVLVLLIRHIPVLSQYHSC